MPPVLRHMLVVGDTITEGAPANPATWVNHLDPVRWTVDNVARSLASAFNWAAGTGFATGRWDPPFVTQDPDLVAVPVGLVDIFVWGRDGTAIEENLIDIVQNQIRPRWPDARVLFLIGTPIWGGALDEDSFMSELRRRFRAAHVQLMLDIAPLDLRDDTNVAFLPEDTDNGIHWSDAVHTQLANAIQNHLDLAYAGQRDSIFSIAEKDLARSLEDETSGTGLIVTLINPNNVALNVTGHAADVGSFVDLNTGQLVSAQHAHVALRMSTLLDGFGGVLPSGKHKTSEKPWRLIVQDIVGNVHRYRVSEAAHDRMLGISRLQMDAWEEAA